MHSPLWSGQTSCGYLSLCTQRHCTNCSTGMLPHGCRVQKQQLLANGSSWETDEDLERAAKQLVASYFQDSTHDVPTGSVRTLGASDRG